MVIQTNMISSILFPWRNEPKRDASSVSRFSVKVPTSFHNIGV